MTKGDPFAPLGRAGRAAAARKRKRATHLCVQPVPKDAPRPFAAHPTLGKPSMTWTYRDAAGAILGYELRFDRPDGKQFRPLTCWRPAASSALEWRWESWPGKRPLYGLDRLAQRPGAPVVVCEGEKAADAASALLSDHVAVTSPNGAKSAMKADWRAPPGPGVTPWPYNDGEGPGFAPAAAKALGG